VPRVTVVIPHYEDHVLIGETLVSIREDERVEVIVVDDGSPSPEAQAKLEQLQREGIRVERREHEGPARAMNHGASVATTEYVFFLASDDLLEPGVLGTLADALDADPGLAFAYGDLEYFGARSGYRRMYEWEPWRANYANCWPGIFMIRREVFSGIGGIPTRSGFEDWDFFMTLAEQGIRGRRLPIVVFRYRQQDSGRRGQTYRRDMREQTKLLRAAHPRLWADRRRLARESGAPRRVRWLFPVPFAVRAHLPVAVGDVLFEGLAALRRLPFGGRPEGN
jgi:glycosyltransferase involved in cell wall biosynthesis